MIEIRKTDEFEKWFINLRDRRAKARIQARIDRMQLGHFGDCHPLGDKVSEMRVFHGPGYRVYFTRIRGKVYVLLTGGDKVSQAKDIARAKKLISRLEV